MTTNEMILRVRQATRQIDSYVRGSLLKEEILLQLNIAQNQYMFVKYKGGQNDPKELVDLRTLQKKEVLNSIVKTTNISNASEFSFPEDFRFTISMHGVYGVSNDVLRTVDKITEAESENFIRTPNNIPVLRTLKAFVNENKLIVLFDPFTDPVTKLEFNYYRTLADITEVNNCELPEHTHDAVCEMAVNRIVGRTSPEEYQISSDILNKTE